MSQPRKRVHYARAQFIVLTGVAESPVPATQDPKGFEITVVLKKVQARDNNIPSAFETFSQANVRGRERRQSKTWIASPDDAKRWKYRSSFFR